MVIAMAMEAGAQLVLQNSNCETTARVSITSPQQVNQGDICAKNGLRQPHTASPQEPALHSSLAAVLLLRSVQLTAQLCLIPLPIPSRSKLQKEGQAA
jgi:hypothetical protein